MNEKGVNSLMESIKKFGFSVPITIDEDNVIITGHTRYKAVLKLRGTLDKYINTLDNQNLINNLNSINTGFIYCIVRDDLTAEQIKEFRITDNKVGELSTWDYDLLKFELRELENAIGFSDEELNRFLKEDIPFEDYTDNDVTIAQEGFDNRFTDMGEVEMLDVCCPKCNHNFFINKNDVLKFKKNKY